MPRFSLGAAHKKTGKPMKTIRRPSESLATELAITTLLSKTSNRLIDASELQRYMRPVTAISIGELIDLPKVCGILGRHGLHHTQLVDGEIVNWQTPPLGDGAAQAGPDLMIMANGTVVGWGLTEDEMLRSHVPTLMASVTNPCLPELEEMDYVEIAQQPGDQPGSFVQGDVLVIRLPLVRQLQLEMAAFAMGLSRLTRLSVLEEELERYVEQTRSHSEILGEGLRVAVKERDILKATGRLFLLRGKLNLYLELIETPDLYWLEPTLEEIYRSVSGRLDIQPRISIMNRKLDYITEEQRALLSVLNERKGTRLEWIIIVLIMVEVCFETFHFVEKYMERSRRNEDQD